MRGWQVGNAVLGTGYLPELMGIVNCTPDSFFDGGKHDSCDAAYAHAIKLLQEGASILDIGGESTRPGAAAVSAEEEIRRVLPVIKKLALTQSERPFWISVDTTKAAVALAAMDGGAHIINDISMGQMDPDMHKAMASTGASIVLNHMRGEPRTMQSNPQYGDVIREVSEELMDSARRLLDLGVDSQKICLDPGICFGKRLEDNLSLIARASELHRLGFPLLYGMSRKSYIGKTPGLAQSDRLIPSVVSAVEIARQGIQVLRVHDVAATREALLMWKALQPPLGL